MFARITTVYIRKDLIEKAIKIFEESIVPAAMKQEGFRSISMYVDWEVGKGIVVSKWESRDNLIANEDSQYYQQQLMKVMVTLAADPIKESYEVVVEA